MAGVPVIGPLMRAIFGTRNERFVKKFTGRVEQIGALEQDVRILTDAQLRAKTEEFRSRYDKGENENDLLIECFAVAREVMDRAVGIRNIFDPEKEFEPTVLSAEGQKLYNEIKAIIDETPDAEPIDKLAGSVDPVPAWKLIEIPVALYDAVRDVYSKSKPPFRARPFDVQLIGGMVLGEHKFASTKSAMLGRDVYFGAISEMKTGEGKTIVAPLACYLHTFARRQIHVVTVNTYLVRRDRDWTFPFFYHLGLTVGFIAPQHELPEQLKKLAYGCDIVYGTTSEFGFDYLRDNMKLRVEDQVQKRRDFAIVDEVDSTLIDEARTPLIISGPAHDDAPRYQIAGKLAAHLVERQKPWAAANVHVEFHEMQIKGIEGDIRNARDKSTIPELKKKLESLRAELPALEDARDKYVQFYEVELDKKNIKIEHEGVSEAQRIADMGSFYVGDNIDMPHLLEQALRARTVYECDKDYVVKDGQVVIVDQFTGRLMIGRQWSDGLHQAIEAKENLDIKPETQTMATITIQNFYRLYERISGMTGTADTEAQEFHDIYSMDVVVIPTNVPVIRSDFNDRIYLSSKDKWASIVDEIKVFHDLGRSVLVGTTSVEHSEVLSQRLTKKYGIQHEVLNAKQHEREANIITAAGSLGAVMIATNMAGRGTDIVLRPIDREELITHWKRRSICPKNVTLEMSDDEVIEQIHRHLAIRELGMKKAEVDAMDINTVVRKLLEHWALEFTFHDERKLAKMSDEDIRADLDEGGNFLLHRIEVWKTTQEMGGLHVIGTERHESRRIDNQLRGRSGRQGDKGSSRFFISLEDDLMKMFAGETTNKILSKLGMKEGDSIEHPMLSRAVERAQRKVEERNFEMRKNILEYDEVMDYQRLDFYGRRQRVLEERGLREIVMDYINEAISDACDRYLAKDYIPTCVAEWVQNKLDVSIDADRLNTDDREALFNKIRKGAFEDYRASTEVTIGEFMNAEADPAEWDVRGLVAWAKERYTVSLKTSEVRESTPKQIHEELLVAAKSKIDSTDLSGVDHYLTEDYACNELLAWANNKFLTEFKVEDIADLTPEEVEDWLTEKSEKAYTEREIRYPVDYALDMYTAMMARDPNHAVEQLAFWANAKYNLAWDRVAVLTKTPQQIREELLKQSQAWNNGKLENAIKEATPHCSDIESLDAWVQERFQRPLTDEERAVAEADGCIEALRARFNRVLRLELQQFEKFVLLQILDGSWKDHLYFMDHLRSSVSFRSFAQQDPRIEYRREGRRQYDEMIDSIGNKVSDLIFKAKMMPNYQPQSQFRGGQAGRTAPTPGAAQKSDATPAEDAAAQGTPGQRADIEAAKRAGIMPDNQKDHTSKTDDRAAKLREARLKKHNVKHK